MHRFNGKFYYRSFCPRAGSADARAQIAAPWTPPGELAVTTDEAGNVSGTLTFSPTAALKISGIVTPAVDKENLPEGIDLTGEGLTAVYRVRGYFVTGSTHITGSVLSIQNDVARQPDGTSGPFVLFPV
jgi:hypothetical protein